MKLQILITLTPLEDLGGGNAAGHGRYPPALWDPPPQEPGFSKMWPYLSMEKALLTPHLFRCDPGFPRPIVLSALEASVEEVVSSSLLSYGHGRQQLAYGETRCPCVAGGWCHVSLSHQQTTPEPQHKDRLVAHTSAR